MLFQVRLAALSLALVFFGSVAISTTEAEDEAAVAKGKTYVVSGQVTDDDGEPVPDAFIVCKTYATGRNPSPSTRSRDDGTFQLTMELNPKVARMYHTWAYAKGHGIRTVSLMGSLSKAVQDGEQWNVPDVKIVLPATGEVTRKVVRPDLTPYAGAEVCPHRIHTPNGAYSADEPTGLVGRLPEELQEFLTQRTDADGMVTFTAIPNALFDSILVTTKDFGAQDFDISFNQFQLSEVGSISGMIVGETDSDLEGSIVSVVSTDSSRRRRAISKFVIGPETQFHIPAIAEGKLTIRLSWADKGTRPIIDPFHPQLSAGSDLKLLIHAEPSIKLIGRLLTEDTREPVAEAKVAHRNTKSPDSGYVETDENGVFEGIVSAGMIDVQVTTMGDDAKLYRIYNYPRIADFRIEPGVKEHDMGDILFQRKPIVRGKVVNQDGTPWANQELGLHSGAYRHLDGSAKTDDEGRFEMPVRSRERLRNGRTSWVVLGERKPKSTESRIKETLEVINWDPDALELRHVGKD